MSEPFESLLPPNATPPERALEAATSRIGNVPVTIADLWNPERCPPPFLPWLAWALSVDEWQSDWDDATKRLVIAESIAIHLRKGSVASVKRILELVGFPAAALIEWWQTPPPGYEGVHSSEPHTFSIGFDPQCSPAPFDPALYQRLTRLLAHTAPVRSHICLFLDARAKTDLSLAPVAASVQSHREIICLEPVPIRAATGLGLAPVAVPRQRERRTYRLSPPPTEASAELGLAQVSRPINVIRLTMEL